MKKSLWLLAVLACGFAAYAEVATLDVSKGDVKFTAEGVTGFAPSGLAVTGIFDSYIIQGVTSEYGVTVEGGTHSITLSGMVSTNAPSAFDIAGGSVSLELAENSENIFISTEDSGLHVAKDASLTIGGSGSLAATSICNGYAGIGGAKEESSGRVEITGGTVVANGALYAAGLGGGSQGAANLRISGGYVKATAGGFGAGIGGGTGWNGPAGTIEITGGQVEGYASNGAGIGCGDEGGHNVYPAGTITISGGSVFGRSDRGAGIGAGCGSADSGRGPQIVINGGSVYGVSGSGSPVGPGEAAGECPDLVNSKGQKLYKASILGAIDDEHGFVSYTVAKTGDETFSYTYEGCGHADTFDLYFYLPNGDYSVKSDSATFQGSIDNADAFFVKKGEGSVTVSVAEGPVVFTSNGVQGHSPGGQAVEGLYEFYTVEGATTQEENTITVKGGAHCIFFSDVDVAVTNAIACDIQSGLIEVVLVGSNAFVSGGGAGLHVASGANLTIYEDPDFQGSLTAIATGECVLNGAGIGANGNEVNGPLTIVSGTIYAQGCAYAAGIGGGAQSPANVTIKGGNVTAVAGAFAAGIGGGTGWGGHAGNIVIEGGFINVIAGNGAGIGCGDEGGHKVYPAGSIVIKGGTINAYSDKGAGIGAGCGPEDSGRGPNITIDNASIYAMSMMGMPIGQGQNLSECPAPCNEAGEDVFGAILPAILPDETNIYEVVTYRKDSPGYVYNFLGHGHQGEDDLFFPYGSLEFYLPNGDYTVAGPDGTIFGGTVSGEETTFEPVPEPACLALLLLSLLALRRK